MAKLNEKIHSDVDLARINRYRENIAIYKGQFERIWRDLKGSAKQVVVVNDAPTVVDPIANLLFREPPDLIAAEPNTQAFVADLIDRNRLHHLWKEEAIWSAVRGDSVFVVGARGDRVVIDSVNPEYVFVVPDPLDITKTNTVHLRFPMPTLQDGRKVIYEQTHTLLEGQGVIMHEVYVVAGDRYVEQLPLEMFASLAGLEPIELTGIDELLVVHLANNRCPGEPYGDSDLTPSIKSKMKARTLLATQRRDVTAKHMDPILGLPEEVLRELQEQGGNRVTVRAEDLKLISLRPNEEIQTAVWDAQLQYAKDEDEILKDQILQEAKISPALLGDDSGSGTGRAGIMRLQVSLGHAQSKQQVWAPAIRTMVRVAAKLENAVFGNQLDEEPVAIAWKDGIAADDVQKAQKNQILVSAGLRSRETAIQDITGWSAAEVADELARIDGFLPVDSE